MKNKLNESKIMQKRADKMIQNHDLHAMHAYMHENGGIIRDSEFILVSKKKASIIKRQEEIQKATKSIDFITSWKRFPRTVTTFGHDAINALKRNVRMRVILERPENLDKIPELIHELNEFPNYHLKFINIHPSAILAIFDNSRVIIKTSNVVGLAEKPSLWTDNMCLVSVLSEYFENCWEKAFDYCVTLRPE